MKTDPATIFRRLKLPTNPVTDGFGCLRDWAPRGELDVKTGRYGWYPGCGYRPIHHGVDFSARPEDTVRAPGAGSYRFDAAHHLILFAPEGSLDADTEPTILIYLLHVDGLQGNSPWLTCDAGQELARHQHGGDFPPHLHFEIAVTPDVYYEVMDEFKLSDLEIGFETIAGRARTHGLPEVETVNEYKREKASDEITFLTDDAFRRRQLPIYKRARPRSTFGSSEVWILDALKVVGK